MIEPPGFWDSSFSSKAARAGVDLRHLHHRRLADQIQRRRDGRAQGGGGQGHRKLHSGRAEAEAPPSHGQLTQDLTPQDLLKGAVPRYERHNDQIIQEAARRSPRQRHPRRLLREAGSAEKTDIARHFGLKGGDRRALRENDPRAGSRRGELGKRGRKGFSEAGALPPVGVADVIERDGDGELYVRLVEASPDAPRAILMPDKSQGRTWPGRPACW